MNYKEKYFKYKLKYLNLKNIYVGGKNSKKIKPSKKITPSKKIKEISIEEKIKQYHLVDKLYRPSLMINKAQIEAYEGVFEFYNSLKNNNLTLVTSESLTGGRIGSTFVDMALGSVLYGGFTVYNTDAKRKWNNVNTPSVYSEETAKQMALGALRNSRAHVALAVTGNSMPYPEHVDSIGIVDVGLALRLKTDKFIVVTHRLTLCDKEPQKQLCHKYKVEGVNTNLQQEDLDIINDLLNNNIDQLTQDQNNALEKFMNFQKNILNLNHIYDPEARKELPPYLKSSFLMSQYPTLQTTTTTSEALRLLTISESTKWATNTLNKILEKEELKQLAMDNNLFNKEEYDTLYSKYGEPTMSKQVLDYPENNIPEWQTADPNLPADSQQITTVKNYFKEVPAEMIKLENGYTAHIYDVIDI